MRIANTLFAAVAASAITMGRLETREIIRSAGSSSLIDPPVPLAQTVKTKYAEVNGIKLAYRQFGKHGGNPVLYFNHFRATMDVTDPLLFNYIAQFREVILFDNSGVGHSEGNVSTTAENMGDNAVGLLKALGVKKAVPFGFSLGGNVAQYVSWQYPDLVEKAVFSGTQSGPGPGVTRGDPKIREVASTPGEPTEEQMALLFFSTTETSLAAAKDWFKRRTDRRVKGETLSGSVMEPGATAQLMALSAFTSSPDNFARLQDIKAPVLVTNGKNDIMSPTVNSFILQQQLPYAYLHLYPDSGHGHPFQFPKAYAQALKEFLDV
ncbi:Alpha/Beta hydrolase protein [Leptodontidium sp. MPI-SDFR-AT-0119]|nr:Alpha/Beta hydrolase protein [Leptodontidium sp. MPI-SDFR-AT-0119]